MLTVQSASVNPVCTRGSLVNGGGFVYCIARLHAKSIHAGYALLGFSALHRIDRGKVLMVAFITTYCLGIAITVNHISDFKMASQSRSIQCDGLINRYGVLLWIKGKRIGFGWALNEVGWGIFKFSVQRQLGLSYISNHYYGSACGPSFFVVELWREILYFL